MLKSILSLMLYWALVVAWPSYSLAANFEGDFIFRWLETPNSRHREMELQSVVAFIDDNGKRWEVPAHAKIDGASIPSFLWTFAGSPFVGNYRRASVIHDHFCDVVGSTTEEITDMFLEAMLADKVSYAEAIAKHGAVYLYQASPLGTCGKKYEPAAKFNDLESSTGKFLTDETKSVIAELNATVEASRMAGNKADPVITELGLNLARSADVKSIDTFQALLLYRDNPNRETYDKLEIATKSEMPEVTEFRQLVYLTAIAIPPG